MIVPAFFGLLLAGLVAGQIVEIMPEKAVRRVGQNVTVLCKVDYPIESCRFTIGKKPYILREHQQLEDDVVYAGNGLKAGECGALIRNIQADLNGQVTCIIPPRSGNIELTAAMQLVVAKAPNPPQLVDSGKTEYVEGEQYEAQCTVPFGRPAATITWYLDEEDLLVGPYEFVLNKDLATGVETIKQNVTLRLTADMGGRRLICSAAHPAWDEPRNATTQLAVQYRPRRADGLQESELTVFGLRPGAEGRLNVTVRASPAPRVAWTIAGATLEPPAHTPDNRIAVLEPIYLGRGYYNISLVLARVEREDVEAAYLLRVHNHLGSLQLAVRISTLDEPAGVELEAGAIVGIVVAALVLILAVSLVVFARATDRWCFAGRRDPAKSSGESSDTESAAGGGASARGRGRLAAVRDWGARVRAALPRSPLGRAARDKVQAADLADDEKAGEEKKGVVYAELALSETPAAGAGTGAEPARAPAPKPAPATEYAEIVYTDQGQKDAKE